MKGNCVTGKGESNSGVYNSDVRNGAGEGQNGSTSSTTAKGNVV